MNDEKKFDSLQQAVETPGLAEFAGWANDVMTAHPPRVALRLIMRAFLAPFVSHVGGVTALDELIGRYIDKVVERGESMGKKGGITTDDLDPFITGMLIGFRTAQVNAANKLLLGQPPELNGDAVDQSGIVDWIVYTLRATGRAKDWAGRKAGDTQAAFDVYFLAKPQSASPTASAGDPTADGDQELVAGVKEEAANGLVMKKAKA